MRKLVLVFTTVILAMPFLYADENGKEYKKMVSKLGSAAESAKNARSSEEFWEVVCKENEELCKFNKLLNEKKAAAIKAEEEINESLEKIKYYYNSLDIEANKSDTLIIRLLKDLGALRVNSQTKLYVVNDTNFEAFASPDMSIYLCTGMLTDKMMYPQILGICAHEFVHCILQHSKVRIFNDKKMDKQNRWITGVQTFLTVGTGSASIDEGVRNISEKNESTIFEPAALNEKKYRYTYSWEQEIEADIIACKFIEYLGYNASEYIEALRVMKGCMPKYLNYPDKSTHPTISYRIGLLEYMVNHHKTVKNKH